MTLKPHFYFQNPPEGVTAFKQKTRYSGAGDEEEDTLVKDYTPKREDFIRSLARFYEDRKTRESHRNHELKVPANVEYIQIFFHDIFDSSVFENRYRTNFGLSPVSYTAFNTVGLFAIVDNGKFEYFIKQLNIFIETTDHLNPKYHPDIKYIKEFAFLSSNQIIRYQEFKKHIVINLIDNVEIFQHYIDPIGDSLVSYLKLMDVNFYLDLDTNKIELIATPESIVKEIADNFDIIQSINSYAAGFVKPSVYNLPEKSYGFEISNQEANLPIIGIVDTGISDQTPLKSIIVNTDNSLNLTSTPVNLDEANHGTAVATLAAFGTRLYPNHIGNFESDAKVLSIKTLNENLGCIAETEVIRLIRTAHENYGVQIFTLTIGYLEPKGFNEEVSEYAYALDKLCYELNILIFIATGNNNELSFWDGKQTRPVTYPLHFLNENSNLCSPAESMNNVTVGASASNFENNDALRISPVGSVPAIYTRTSHINWIHDALFNKRKEINWFRANKKLFKPDVCNNGGDYDFSLNPSTTGIKVLSTETGVFFDRSAGTSFSTPLTANLAAKILNAYPKTKENMQTVKALILNSAQYKEVGDAFANLSGILPNAIFGNGIPSNENCLYSSENRVTFILEDTIKPDEIKCYPINIPKYLLDVDRTNSLLKVKATLCFKFHPLKHHHLAYCPIHVAFGVFRNLPLDEYKKDGKGDNIKDDKGKPISIGINVSIR